MNASVDVRRLRELVVRHKAVFELRPAYAIVNGRRLQIGFDVELYGTHSQWALEGAEPEPAPGCERCVAVYRDLVDLAKAVLPPEDRPTAYYIEPFDHSLRYFKKRRTANRDRPDVQLDIEVRHREGFEREVDPCESRCVQEILAGLRALGVQEGTWNDYRAQLFNHEHAGDDAAG